MRRLLHQPEEGGRRDRRRQTDLSQGGERHALASGREDRQPELKTEWEEREPGVRQLRASRINTECEQRKWEEKVCVGGVELARSAGTGWSCLVCTRKRVGTRLGSSGCQKRLAEALGRSGRVKRVGRRLSPCLDTLPCARACVRACVCACLDTLSFSCFFLGLVCL